jgi:hypothetical protein
VTRRVKIDRLSRGERIAASSAALLFVFMFLDWFGTEVAAEGGGAVEAEGGGSAWGTLDFIPIVLLVAIVVVLIGAGLRLAGSDYKPPVQTNAAIAVLGGLSTLLILFRIVVPPGIDHFGGLAVDATPQVGIFLGLLAAAGIAYGGYTAMRGEGLSFGDAADRLGDSRN